MRYHLYAILGLVTSWPVAAFEVTPWLELNGFGTLGAFYGDDPVGLVRVDPRQLNGSRNELRFDGDSQLSLQATINPQGALKGTVQVLYKQNYQGQMRAELEWAYLSWDATPELNIKLGRTVAPLFLMSDYRNLYYAQTLIRPLPEVYNLNAVSHLDGISALWQTGLSMGDLQLNAYYGKTNIELVSGDAEAKWMAGAYARWDYQGLTLRAGLSSNSFSYNAAAAKSASQLIASLPPSLCSNCQSEINSKVKFSDLRSTTLSLGLIYEQGPWLLQSELAARNSDSVTAGSPRAGYAIASYRWGDWTPSIFFAKTKSTEDGLNFVAGPAASAALQQRLAYLNASYFGRGFGDHTNLGLGLRWDFARNLALKLQVEHLNYDQAEIGASGGLVSYPTSLLGKPSGFDGKVNLYSLNLDFIF